MRYYIYINILFMDECRTNSQAEQSESQGVVLLAWKHNAYVN